MSTTDYNKVFGNAAIIRLSTVVANVVAASSVGSVDDFMNHAPNLFLAPNSEGLVVVIFTAEVT
jgi:hypothetical protein